MRQSGENGVAPGANAGVSGANSRTYEDDVVSIGSGNGRGGPATRRITDVTAGVNATDAVNVAQLRHVADVAENTAQFFKASPGEESVGAYVEGDSALAAGEGANAVGTATTALGTGANAVAENATAVGTNALASGQNSAAFGHNAQANGPAS
ncbi:hypothetical protein BRM76_11015, partial [Xanthomonas oryzae pv. oryzae]